MNARAEILTLAYITARKQPMFNWWCDALHHQCGGDYTGLRVVVVDFFADAHKPEDQWSQADAQQRRSGFRALCRCPDFVHTPPIWGPWQGPHRLTKDNWWAKAEYLNAAVCYAPGAYLASCDDGCVPAPTWLESVRTATKNDGNTVTNGAYQKVADLVVVNGIAESATLLSNGKDPRWAQGRDDQVMGSFGSDMYGCCFVTPVEPVLRVDGWPSCTNGLGYEDSPMGQLMARACGTTFLYDRKMLVLQSQDLRRGTVIRREDPGESPNDKSHALVDIACNSVKWENHYGQYGLRGLRTRVLAGDPLPVITEPRTEWFTGRKLEDL